MTQAAPNSCPNQPDQAQATDGLHEHWFVACTQQELKPATPLGTKVLGLGIVIFRDRNGKLAALVDQCVHRGTRLSAGKVEGDCLVCPYHGWRFDTQGKVVHIPTIDGVKPKTQASDYPFRQRTLPVREQHGLIWVYLGIADADAKPIFQMPFHADPAWQSYFMVNTFDGDISMLAQNFMDVPHTIFVHEGIFRSSSNSAMEATVELKAESVEVSYHDNKDKIGMMDWLTNPHGDPLAHTDKFFIPNVTRCDYLWGQRTGFLIVSQITPLDAQGRQSRVYTYITYRLALPRWVQRLLRPLIHFYTHIVIQQDVKIMRANRQGLDNAPAFTAHNVRADVVHVGIERLLAAVRKKEALPAAQQGKRSIRFEM